MSKTSIFAAALGLTLVAAGCSGGASDSKGTPAPDPGKPVSQGDLKGDVTIDGSSTVYKISQAMAEDFMASNSGVNVKVSESGTGGGMKKFVAGEIDICDASRTIKEEEIKAAKEKGIEYVELQVALDGITVVVNPKNTWAQTLTTEELKKMWEDGSKIANWKDVRAGFPDKPLKLYGPGTDSGTFEYFTEEINKKKKSARTDVTTSEDDNVLVTGVAGDEGGLGYFGYAYYVQNKDKVAAVKIDAGSGPVAPTDETILSGAYKPLSRPLFIYVSKSAIARPEVKAFVAYYIAAANREKIHEVGYTLCADDVYAKTQAAFDAATK